MLTLASLIILALSFLGMLFIIIRKWSELKILSIAEADYVSKPFSTRAKEKIRNLNPANGFSSEKFLKKFFIKLKILLLKGERKIDQYLHRVSHSEKFGEDYWDKVKKGE
jgi:hypothetical protein